MSTVSNRLHLSDLVIRGFRGIADLEISRLGRVTLLTGRNGVGKTTALEALETYACAAGDDVLYRILQARGELPSEDEARTGLRLPVNWLSLFHGHRKWLAENGDPLNPVDSDDAMPVFNVGPKSESESLTVRLRRSSDEMLDRLWRGREEVTLEEILPLSLYVRFRGQEEREVPTFDVHPRWRRAFLNRASGIACRRIGPELVENRDLARCWDSVALTPQESLVVEALGHVVADQPKRVAMLGAEDREGARFVVKLASQEERVPLKSLGDGANRFFGLVLVLATVKGGMLLIDEVENGIHHQVQQNYWSLIFDFAREHGVQVIATTHSWDAVKGFASAAEGRGEDAALIRIQRGDHRIEAVEYTPDEIQIVAEQGIEVR